MANPPGIHQQDGAAAAAAFNGAHHSANGSAAPESLGSGPVLKHNPGISCEWTAEEQAILEDGLAKYASESSINRYSKIAIQLNNKTVRDVAFRCRWMSTKETSKRRKEENLAKKNKDRKERVDSSGKPFSFASQANGSSNTNMAIYDDGMSYNAIGGVAGKLLEQNAQVFSQISTNISTMQIQENINLLCQTRDNILRIINGLNDAPEIMRQMPVLPVSLNEGLASTILPRSNLQRSAY